MAISNSFDMNRAWEEATALLTANRQTVVVVAGVFFFLPYLAISLFVPDLSSAMGGTPVGGDPDAAMAAMEAAFMENWWVIGLMTLAQGIGTLGLLALLGKSGRPPLGEALRDGTIGLLPYLAANFLVVFGMVAVIVLLTGLLSLTGSTLLATLPLILAFPVMVYVFVKVSLVSPIIAAEDERNPIAAIKRSWRLTKGNSFRLFLFFALLMIAIVILSLVLSLITGLVFALFGESVAQIGGGIIGATVNAISVAVLLGVIAAVHRQLSGHATRASVPLVSRED